MQSRSISDIAKRVSSGITPLRSNPDYWSNGSIPWLKTEQLGEKYIYDTNEKISDVALDQTSIKLDPPNTLSIAMYGEGKTRGNLSIIKSEMTTNQACCNVEVNSKKADYEYIYYYLKTQYEVLRNLSSVVRKNLNTTDIKEFCIRLPETIEKQKKIAGVLSSIDKKIELNNKINAELEAMAKLIYDYWFVQFDFPDANGKPYKSSGGKMVYNETLKREIPDGWVVSSLSSIPLVSKETLNPADHSGQEFKLFSIPTLDTTKTYGVELGGGIGSNKFIVTNKDILVSKLNPWFNRVVYVAEKEDQICSTEFVVWRTRNIENKNFLYMIATSQQFIAFCTQSATGTSNSHKRINPSVMMSFMQPVSQSVVEILGKRLDPIIKTIILNQQQNTHLAKLRDWLLPMLMNGQITVKDAPQ